MSSELNRIVGVVVVVVVVRGKTGSARLCLRLRRPPSPSPPALSGAPVPVPAPPPPPVLVVGIPLPLRRPTKAGTLMRNREFREGDDLPVGNGSAAGRGARNGASGEDPRGEIGDVGEVGVSGEVGTGEMDMTPLYPLEAAANGVAELIEGDIGISKMDEANVNVGGRRGWCCLLSISSCSPSRSTEPRFDEFCTTCRRFIRLRCHHSNKNITRR